MLAGMIVVVLVGESVGNEESLPVLSLDGAMVGVFAR